MIDFSMPPYKWQNEMNTVYHDVNLTKINIGASTSADFNFCNSYDGKYIGALICSHVWKIDIETYSHVEFPAFVCDVRVKKLSSDEKNKAFEYLNYKYEVPEVETCYLVCLDSGELSIKLLCEDIV